MALDFTALNPLTWIEGLFGGMFGGGSPGTPVSGAINVQTIMAILGVAKAFNVNPAGLNPDQMAAISLLMAAMGYGGVPLPIPATH